MILLKLYKAGLLKPISLIYLIRAFGRQGSNLLTILDFTAKRTPKAIAIHLKNQIWSYEQLYKDSLALAHHLNDISWKKGQKVALISYNSYPSICFIFACSRIGVNLCLLNREMSLFQFETLTQAQSFDILVFEDSLNFRIDKHNYSLSTLFAKRKTTSTRLAPRAAAMLTVLTSGTSGQFKTAARKPSPTAFLAPFFTLLSKAHLYKYEKVYIATPIYHGFGLAALIMSTVLGASIYMDKKFNLPYCLKTIKQENSEVLITVPLIYKRLLDTSWASKDLASLKIVLSGGAPLKPQLIKKSYHIAGSILYNLYGTSEAGFCIMADPKILSHHPNSIGRPIRGVRVKLLKEGVLVKKDNIVGEILIRSTWTVKQQWIHTGDLAYWKDNCLFICGRIDDMIISGGENIYPIEIERVLLQHPKVLDASVVGISDADFGQRSIAILSMNTPAKEEEIKQWLKPNLARYQMPKRILFVDNLPYNKLGKIDRQAILAIIQQKLNNNLEL